MQWMIPGTVLQAEREEAGKIEEQFRAMFFGGGMVLSQVASISGLEPYTIQNWVKRGFLAPPVQKKYSLRQLCRILNINMLKASLRMEDICGLLGYINGQLDDEGDDLIDDTQLYFLFIRLACHYSVMQNPEGRDDYIRRVLEDYREPMPGAKQRVEKVLRVMLTAWAAALLCSHAESMVAQLKEET